jgi:glycerophosphoryl diester phosphodiesterase
MTMHEVYELIAPTTLSLNIELKTTQFLYPELPEKLLALEKEFKMTERVIYSSFNHYSLMALRALAPAAKIGLLYELGMVDPWLYANQLSATAIHPAYQVIAFLPETVAQCHAHHVKVNVWTPDEPEMMRLMLQAGVDGIITNKPDIALKCREEFEKQSNR